ncbi:hypothetical protein DYB37_002533 [Aphanomyces astaci]|uniref:Uncharacterized protein n=1 Tax=Aphanomyces astaci TaxID=112090 RepID=A0A418D973_APHAT|nr:hypothetical protein DYB35_004015 [Aphanomyces astaci]RHZ20089.1 hypothetical protein DYB37_002533 [Aphanomyces astaci]
MRHRSHSAAATEGGSVKFLLRKSTLQAFLAVCLVGVVLVYFEMFKLSSVMSQVGNANFLDNLRRHERNETPKPTFDESASPSIAVMLTHYRDTDECVSTLQSLYSTAQYPASLHIYIFEEVVLGSDNDSTCVQLFCQPHSSLCDAHGATRIHQKRRHAADYNGPGPARAMVESMVVPSRHVYYLSITTRLEFTPRWDVALIAQWTAIGNPKAILSFAPPAVRAKSWSVDPSQHAILCTGRITSERSNIAVVAFNPPVLIPEPRDPDTPRLVAQYSEDFHFGSIAALTAAPSDAKVEFVWEGLAYYRAVRWWTRGYDFYSPSTDVVWESYTRRVQHPLHPSSIHATKDPAMAKLLIRQKNSYFRIRRVLGFNMGEPPSPDDDKYTVGSVRTMDQWVTFSGLDHTAEKDDATDKQFQNCHAMPSLASDQGMPSSLAGCGSFGMSNVVRFAEGGDFAPPPRSAAGGVDELSRLFDETFESEAEPPKVTIFFLT